MSINLNKSCRKQQGFNLLEVMVAVIVSALGLLGMVGLQISSINTANVAWTNTQSTTHIQQIVDILRADQEAAKNGSYNIGGSNGLVAIKDLTAPSRDSSAQAVQLYNWVKSLNTSLPEAEAGIYCDSDGMCAIKIRYFDVDKDKTASSAGHSQQTGTANNPYVSQLVSIHI